MPHAKSDNKLMNLIIEVCNYTTIKQNKKIGIITLRMGIMEWLIYCFKIIKIINVLPTYEKRNLQLWHQGFQQSSFSYQKLV